MTKNYLDFAKIKVTPLPRFVSRRFPGALQRGFFAYKSDAPDDDEAALLAKVQAAAVGRVEAILAERSYANGAAVKTAIETALSGLSIEALRSYGADKTALEESIRTLSGKLTQVESKAGAPGAVRSKTAPFKELLEKNWGAIEKMMRNKGQGGGNNVITLNTRAAVIMTMDAAIDEPVDMPDDIIESFSAEAFVKKRRGVEYLWEIVSRRTVAAIKEYKTWLSEGDEEGAFAVVAEGAVKPLMSKNLVRNHVKYRKVAGKRVYTEEFAKFRQEAFAIIEDLFNDKIMRDYNAILVTSLNAKAAAYVGTSLDDQYVNPTDYHAVGAVAAQIESLEFYPDLLIINPQDKWRIGLQQASDGHFFVNVPTYDPSGTVRMMGFRVFTLSKMEVGQAILGEAGLYKVEDEPIQVRLGYGIDVVTDGNGFVTSVTSDVDNNRFRIIAETFFHNWIASEHLGSFVKFSFATVKAALLKP